MINRMDLEFTDMTLAPYAKAYRVAKVVDVMRCG